MFHILFFPSTSVKKKLRARIKTRLTWPKQNGTSRSNFKFLHTVKFLHTLSSCAPKSQETSTLEGRACTAHICFSVSLFLPNHNHLCPVQHMPEPCLIRLIQWEEWLILEWMIESGRCDILARAKEFDRLFKYLTSMPNLRTFRGLNSISLRDLLVIASCCNGHTSLFHWLSHTYWQVHV